MLQLVEGDAEPELVGERELVAELVDVQDAEGNDEGTYN